MVVSRSDRVAGRLPGLVLLDLMMPEMDGLTFLEQFRLSSARSSGAGDRPDRERSDSRGSSPAERIVEQVVGKGSKTGSLLKEVREIVAAQSMGQLQR